MKRGQSQTTLRSYIGTVLQKRARNIVRTASLIFEAGVVFWIFLRLDHWLIQQAVILFHEEIERIPLVATIIEGIQILSALAILIYYCIHIVRLLFFEVHEEEINP